MKKAIAIFFLFIISIQCLPVKQLGKCLFDSSFIEEEEGKKAIDKNDCCDHSKDFYYADMSAHTLAEIITDHFHISINNVYPAPVTDVTTPPPNA